MYLTIIWRTAFLFVAGRIARSQRSLPSTSKLTCHSTLYPVRPQSHTWPLQGARNVPWYFLNSLLPEAQGSDFLHLGTSIRDETLSDGCPRNTSSLHSHSASMNCPVKKAVVGEALQHGPWLSHVGELAGIEELCSIWPLGATLMLCRSSFDMEHLPHVV